MYAQSKKAECHPISQVLITSFRLSSKENTKMSDLVISDMPQITCTKCIPKAYTFPASQPTQNNIIVQPSHLVFTKGYIFQLLQPGGHCQQKY